MLKYLSPFLCIIGGIECTLPPATSPESRLSAASTKQHFYLMGFLCLEGVQYITLHVSFIKPLVILPLYVN